MRNGHGTNIQYEKAVYDATRFAGIIKNVY